MGHTGRIAIDDQATSSANRAAEEEFAALFKAQYHRVVRALVLGGLSLPAAEDAAQEAFARTLYHWRRVRRGTNPAGYVFTTAFRLSRRQLSRPVEVAYEDDLASRGPADPISEALLLADVEAVLATLPPRRRACAVLCLVVGMSTKEAARALGIAEGTVRKQLKEARRALEKALGAG